MNWAPTIVNRRLASSLRYFVALLPVPAAVAADVGVNEPGFEIVTYASGLDEPVAMEFAPDGRLFVAERGGTLRFVYEGVVVDAPVAQIDVITENENGLVGLALDPEFSSNGFIYLFATVSSQESQIIRVTEKDGVAAEIITLREHLPTRGAFHSGGGLKVGPDGKLYFGIGDNLVVDNSQDMGTLAGKVSRINLDGSTPADNPFKTPTGVPRAAFAIGFRNPFRFCFAPDGRLFVMDVGSDGDGRREEINLVAAGDNCGWPIVEGRQSPPADARFRDPIYDYHDGGAAPVGAVYYTGAQLGGQYNGNLFHLEYVLNRLYRVVLDGDTVVSHTLFAQLEGGPVDLVQGLDGSLYYSELHRGRIQQIRARTSIVAGQTATADAPAGGAGGFSFSGLCGAGVVEAMLLCGLALFVVKRDPSR